MINILFIENGKPSSKKNVGGSYYSLFQIVKKLNTNNFRIFLSFTFPNAMINDYYGISKNIYVYRRTKLDSIINSLIWLFVKLKILPIRMVNLKYMIFIYRIIKKNKIDIIHFNDRLTSNIDAIIIGLICKKKCIIHQRQYDKQHNILLKIIAKKINLFIAISNSIERNIREIYKIDEKKIKVIYNWVDTNLGFKNNKQVIEPLKIIWIGRLVEWKGVELMIEIIKFLKKQNLDLITDVYGDFEHLDYKIIVEKKIDCYKLTNNFFFKGYQKFADIKHEQYFAFFHTSILPEPFGRTIIEAMAYNLPVFAVNKGGVGEIISDRINGLLFDSNNLMKIYEDFKLLLDKKNFRDEIINDAIKNLKLKFSSENFHLLESQYYNLYENKN